MALSPIGALTAASHVQLASFDAQLINQRFHALSRSEQV
jgi:hypothetical protein